MSALGPGVLVRCVDDSPAWGGRVVPLVCGAIYTVDDVFPPDMDGDTGVTIVEARCEIGTGVFKASRFVPVDDTALDIFRSALTDTPAEEDA